MAIYRMLNDRRLGPAEAGKLAAAYELTLIALDLKERGDPFTEVVAKKVLEVSQRGVRDAQQISMIAAEELRN